MYLPTLYALVLGRLLSTLHSNDYLDFFKSKYLKNAFIVMLLNEKPYH